MAKVVWHFYYLSPLSALSAASSWAAMPFCRSQQYTSSGQCDTLDWTYSVDFDRAPLPLRLLT